MPRSPASAALIALFAALALPVAAAETGSEADKARISELRAQAKDLRDEAEATFSATEPGCYRKFLVNRCIDEAKKRRLDTIREARALESEARGIDLAERQRVAAMIREGWPEGEPQPAPTPDIALPPAQVPLPSPDPAIAIDPERSRLQAEREAAAARNAQAAAASRASRDADRAAARARAEAEAAQRAEAAARDRARYDERIRKFEEEHAQPPVDSGN